MPMRTSIHNESVSPIQSLQDSPSGLPRRSNSVSSPTAASSEQSHRRLKRNRHGSGASSGYPDGPVISRKSRRIRPPEESPHESSDLSQFLPDKSQKCYADSGESESNSRMEVIKTVVEEVVGTVDVSGTQTPQSNDEEGNNSENDDEHVAKLPQHPSFHVHVPPYASSIDTAQETDSGECGGNEIIINQRSLCDSSSPPPSGVPCSINCDPPLPSTSKSFVSKTTDPSLDEAFRRLPQTSLSSFSSVTSLVESGIEPFSSMVPSPNESHSGDQVKGKSCPPKTSRLPRSKSREATASSLVVETDDEPHVYPLRSRLRYEREKREWEARLLQPRNLDTLPFEIVSRIVQYLSVQDLFVMQCLNKRLRIAARNHLASLKRINFSSGLPFAYLPEKLDDEALRRILSCTPEVTHILGFYPRRINESTAENGASSPRLTYEGIINAFRSCTKLRSVELMDVDLMSRLVSTMPNVKFHGMFRNRPDSWDSEYAVPLPPEPPQEPPTIPVSAPNPSPVARFVLQQAARFSRLAWMLEPSTDPTLSQGSPPNNATPYIFSPTSYVSVRLPSLQQESMQQPAEENSLYNSMMTFLTAAAGGSLERSRSSSSSANRRHSFAEFVPGIVAAASAAGTAAYEEARPQCYSVSPFHLTRSPAVPLPDAIANLTKLDLVGVSVTVLPRLDNVKYLHLKWVHFSNQDPFVHFQANKLQSFVMNNCVGPRRYIRFIRLFVFLTRATQIMRLELVGSRFVEGLFEQLIDRHAPHIPCFRSLQRLIMAGDRDVTVSDIGLVLFCAQQSLTHVALQTFHCDNGLFEALNFARVRLPRLESLVLGYQDPYLSRLSLNDMQNLDLCASSDAVSPFCSLTNRGLTLALSVCPRISSLTVRHAPYITRFPRAEDIVAAAPAPSSPPPPPPAPASNPPPVYVSAPPSTQLILKLATIRPGMSVKCLVLENCPGLDVVELENMISRGDPFSVLESLVLRDMFPPSRPTSNRVAAYNWTLRWMAGPPPPSTDSTNGEDDIGEDYRKLGLLLTIADLLASRMVAHPPLSPFGIGMGASVRDVSQMGPNIHQGPRPEPPVHTFDIFFALRTHTYLTSILQMDGSVGSVVRLPRLVFDASDLAAVPSTAVEDPLASSGFFASRSTQTCVCGLMEWDFLHRMCSEGEEGTGQSPSSSETEGFQAHCVVVQHNAFFQKVLCSDWADRICASRLFNRLRSTQKSFVRPLCGPNECPGCASGRQDAPSSARLEPSLTPWPRTWTARDASVDTSDLRCYTGPSPCVFTLRQPLHYPFSCLTTLHLEKVGITHLVLSSVPRLKNLTLENCPVLAGVLLAPTAAAVSAAPVLKRVRVLRCPKFAIWNWLAVVAKLFPHHEENLFITYRPFGAYNEFVEQAFWRLTKGAHVVVSHDYSTDRSERAMEETNSAFEQRFRELMQLTECAGDLQPMMPMLQTRLFHSDRGDNWNFMTDASWMPKDALNPSIEVSLAKPIPPTGVVPFAELSTDDGEDPQDPPMDAEGLRKTEARQRRRFGEFLDAYRRSHVFHARGVHLHVQYRDVHGEGYLTWPYTERYLKSIAPEEDFNVWGDGHDVVLREQLPPNMSIGLRRKVGGAAVKRENETAVDDDGPPRKCRILRLDAAANVCDNGP